MYTLVAQEQPVHSKSLAMRCKCVRERTGLCPKIKSQWCLYFEAKSDFQKDPELCLYVLVHLELHEQSLIDEEERRRGGPRVVRTLNHQQYRMHARVEYVAGPRADSSMTRFVATLITSLSVRTGTFCFFIPWHSAPPSTSST